MIERLVLFGATGDLAGRYLLPALAALQHAGELPDGFELAGAGREDWDDAKFRQVAADRLEEHASSLPASVHEGLVARLSYRQFDLAEPDSVARAVGETHEPVACYLALPPGLFAPAVEALGSAGLAPGSRIALEKPFGEALGGAEKLNRLLARVAENVGEHVAFRIDHFLGLAPVQNLLALRFANRVLEPVWNSEHVARVDVVWEETLALEGRAAYYDNAGQLKDMIQNHLMQVLCLLAMEAPANLEADELRDRKLHVLHSVRPISADEMEQRTRRARYTAGRIGEREVPAYADEEGVDPERGTETFAQVELELDSPRWAGTRFRLRTGKAMGRKRMEVVVRFRPAAKVPFGEEAGEPGANALRIALDEPQAMTFELSGNLPGPPLALVPLELRDQLPAAKLPEYGRVLMNILSGDSTLSVRGDEAEEAWRIVTPILEAWRDGQVPLEEYAAGSAGPSDR